MISFLRSTFLLLSLFTAISADAQTKLFTYKPVYASSDYLDEAVRSAGRRLPCQTLAELVKEEGYKKNSVSSLQLYQSSWLKSVDAYEYEDIIFVIAEIKKDKYSFSTQSYIFCGVPSANWDKFYYGLSDLDKSYGERFHKYIINYECNCN